MTSLRHLLRRRPRTPLAERVAALADQWEAEAAAKSAGSRSARVSALGYRHAADIRAALTETKGGAT